jgi:Fanconi anemia group M protein
MANAPVISAEAVKPLPTLLVDSRESRSEVPSWLKKLGYATDSAELQVGDYWAPGFVIVERKVNTDFILSIMDQRLFGQAELMACHEDRAVMIIEGPLNPGGSQIEPESLAGALSALVMYYGLQILPTTGPEQTARVIGRLLRNRVEGLGYDIPSRASKPKIDGAMSQYLLEGCPGIGPAMARRLLVHFGSAGAVFAASAKDLQAVKGIGAKMAEAMLYAIHHKPSAFRDTKGPAPASW